MRKGFVIEFGSMFQAAQGDFKHLADNDQGLAGDISFCTVSDKWLIRQYTSVLPDAPFYRQWRRMQPARMS